MTQLHVTLATLALGLIATSTAAQAMPHYDLEMTGAEYRRILEAGSNSPLRNLDEDAAPADSEDPVLNNYLRLGKRNLDWVDLVNSKRTPETRISLSSAATQQGYPLNAPRVMNFKIVQNDWAIVETLLPKALKDVLFGGAPLTADVPVTDREFIEWLFQVDRAYQLAARYKLMKPWRSEMTAYAAYDVRGYLTLRDDKNIDQKLTNFNNLGSSAKRTLTVALEKICRNAEVRAETCADEVAAAARANGLVAFKNRYYPIAQQNYESFFKISQTRKDITWAAANPNLMTIPFANPHNDTVLDFLRFNIEDEFRWNGWQLKLDFIETKSLSTTHIVFEDGATPHVDELAGSEITMDGNAPLSEYDVQWTIRHEYGHVLGLPDCYFEFYDEDAEATVSYQLDITDLMCSRRGHFKQTHFDELKRAYFK